MYTPQHQPCSLILEGVCINLPLFLGFPEVRTDMDGIERKLHRIRVIELAQGDDGIKKVGKQASGWESEPKKRQRKEIMNKQIM